MVAPRILGVTPASGAEVFPILTTLTVQFDADMATATGAAGSVTNLANYQLIETRTGRVVSLQSATYDAALRRVRLAVAPLAPGEYRMTVRSTVTSERGIALSAEFSSAFVLLDDLTAILPPVFSNTRSNSVTETVTFDLTVTNALPYAISAPLRVLFPALTASADGIAPGVIDASGLTADRKSVV